VSLYNKGDYFKPCHSMNIEKIMIILSYFSGFTGSLLRRIVNQGSRDTSA